MIGEILFLLRSIRKRDREVSSEFRKISNNSREVSNHTLEASNWFRKPERAQNRKQTRGYLNFKIKFSQMSIFKELITEKFDAGLK